jgi:hypothetical protein
MRVSLPAHPTDRNNKAADIADSAEVAKIVEAAAQGLRSLLRLNETEPLSYGTAPDVRNGAGASARAVYRAAPMAELVVLRRLPQRFYRQFMLCGRIANDVA